MLNIFRVASLLEGCSFLLILSVSLGFISRELIFPLGMGQGTLFLLYFVLSLLTSHKQSWSVFAWLAVLLAGVIPFAFIAGELFLKKKARKSSEAAPQI